MYCKTRRRLNDAGIILEAKDGKIRSKMTDGSKTPPKLRRVITRHKSELLQELRGYRLVKISGEEFYGPGLMADAAERAKRRNNHE